MATRRLPELCAAASVLPAWPVVAQLSGPFVSAWRSAPLLCTLSDVTTKTRVRDVSITSQANMRSWLCGGSGPSGTGEEGETLIRPCRR